MNVKKRFYKKFDRYYCIIELTSMFLLVTKERFDMSIDWKLRIVVNEWCKLSIEKKR